MSERSRWLALLATLGAVAGTLQVRSVDFFWQLAAGRWIFSHGEIPRHDPFRFTSGAAPWIDHEWLFQVALAGIERLGGVDALVAARALFAVLWVLVLATALRRTGTSLSGTALVTGLALVVVRGRLFLRPEIVTLAGLTLLLTLLQRRRRHDGGRGNLLALFAVVVVWANGHPGAMIAPVVAAAYLLGTRLTGGWGSPTRGAAPRPWREVVGLPVALAVALLANPYGVEIYRVPSKIAQALQGLDAVNPDWANAWAAPRPFFFAGLVALLLLVGWTRRSGARLDPATGLAVLVLLPLGFAGVRHQPLVAIAAAFLAAETMAALPLRPDPRPGLRARLPATALATCLAIAAWCVASPTVGPLRARGAAPRFGTGIHPGLQPAAAVDRIAAMPDLGPLYHDVAFGGYLLWRLFPPRKIFLDTRNEVDPELLREVEAARRDSRRWDALLARYGIDGALVRYDERPIPVYTPPHPDGSQPPPELHTSSALLFPPDRFALVFWDDVSLLFLRRTPQRDAELRDTAYEHVQPEDWRAMLAVAARDAELREEILRELEHRVAEDPPSERARQLLEVVRSLPAPPSR